jgi:hypothetical protein
MAEQSRVWSIIYRTGQSLENRYNESFNGKLRDELLNGEIFYTLKEAKIMIEMADSLQYQKAAYQPWVSSAST